MSELKKAVRTGVVVGVAAGAAWLISKRYLKSDGKLIDWAKVRRIAIATCRQTSVGIPFSRRMLSAEYAQLVRQAEKPISEYTGKQLPHALEHVHVFDRIDWIDANIDNFQLLFEPFEHLNRQAHRDGSATASMLGGFNQMLISGQMGLLLGYMAQRVLGQYDLSLLGREPITTGRLYFVEPNIRGLQQRLALDSREFRMWIVLHETTHAFEFEANPWLRGYMNSLLTRYFETLSSDFGRIRSDSSGLRTMADRMLRNVFTSSNVLELMMTPDQRHIFNQLQALMSLLEGYSNHIMQAIGESILPSYHYLKERFDDRARHKSTAEKLFAKFTGMDIKMEQYAQGERFVNEIVRRRGIDFMNRVWESPLVLPTLEEIRQPEKWIDRMERVAA